MSVLLKGLQFHHYNNQSEMLNNQNNTLKIWIFLENSNRKYKNQFSKILENIKRYL